MTKPKVPKIQIPSATTEDQPATRRMLSLVRDELVQRMDSGNSTLRGEIAELRGELRSNVAELRGSIEELRGELRGNILELRADYSRMAILLEEQNANNRIVLEGLQALWQRQDRIEKGA